MTNLIGNALKFTDKGNITFGCELNDNKLYFYVKDTGIGIPEEKIDLIFERFEQINHKYQDFNDGTGLGLSISKGIIELLGGKLKVESEEGKGSLFSFEIPFLEIKPESPSVKNTSYDSHEILKGKTLLIVEDDPINIEYFKSLFHSIPMKLLFAENGKKAVETVKVNANIDIILMDLRMPIMNGYEATKKILELFPDKKIIAQTAYAMASDKSICLENGFVDYISKPIDKTLLMNKLIHWTT